MQQYFKHIILFLFTIVMVNQGLAQCESQIGSNVALEGCSPFTVQFNDLSEGLVSTRTWNFGDGEFSDAQNPDHTFEIDGTEDTTFVVELTIQCIGGDVSTSKVDVVVRARPPANFKVFEKKVCALSDSACMVNFNEYDSTHTYNWNWGDNSSSQGYEPCHIYSESNTFTVTLTVVTQYGCERSTKQPNSVETFKPPSPSFDIDTFIGCEPLTIEFQNTTVEGEDSIETWAWDFDDGTPIWDKDFVLDGKHVFKDADTFFVTLGATSQLGCYNSTVRAIVAKPRPGTDFRMPPSGCVGESVFLEYSGTYPGEAVLQWTFEDAAITDSAGLDYNVTWNINGNKLVTLRGNIEECDSYRERYININSLPIVFLESDILEDTICERRETIFEGNPILYPWYFFTINDSVYASERNEYRYITDYLYDGDTVTISVIDQNGCYNDSEDTLFVDAYELPNVSLNSSSSNDSICEGDTIVFDATPTHYEEYVFVDNYDTVQIDTSSKLVYPFQKNKHAMQVYALENGCYSISNAIVTVVTTVLPPLKQANVNCYNSTLSSIGFQWDEVKYATGYQVKIDTNDWIDPSAGFDSLYHIVNGVNPGDSLSIIVAAMSNHDCSEGSVSDTFQCFAKSCSPITFDLKGDNDHCIGDSVFFNVSNIEALDDYTMFLNGDTLQDTTIRMVAVDSTEILVLLKQDSEAECPGYYQVAEINVDTMPIVSLSSTAFLDSICETFFVEFLAEPTYYDDYQFLNRFHVAKQGPEPFYLTDSLITDREVRVVATNGQCIDTSDTAIVTTVVEKLDIPQVNCGNATDTSITFIWDSVPSALGYQISVNGGPFVTSSDGYTSLTHTITGLDPGVEVTLMVMAEGESRCGNSSYSLPASCITDSCTAITFDKNDDPKVCEGERVWLEISNLSTDNYDISWNGEPGNEKLAYEFTATETFYASVRVIDLNQTKCPAARKFWHVEVFERPTPVLYSSANNDTICEGDLIVVEVNPTYYDNYTFYDGYAIVQDGPNPVYMTDELLDGHTIKAIASNLGCSDSTKLHIRTTVLPPLDPPQVNCGTTTDSSITFTWDEIEGALGYKISLNGGNFIDPSNPDEFQHHLTGLNYKDSVVAEVKAIGPPPCGSTVFYISNTCKAMNCEDIQFTRSDDQEVCAGESVTVWVDDINTNKYQVLWNGEFLANQLNYTLVPEGDTIIKIEVRNLREPECPYETKYITLTSRIVPAPTLESSATNDSICLGDEVTFTADPASYDLYTFYDGYVIVQNSGNPVYVTDSLEDERTITVVAEFLGCKNLNSDSIKITTEVIDSLDEPQVNCGRTTDNSVQFKWDEIENAYGYNVILLDTIVRPSTGNKGLSHTVNGLQEFDTVTIVLEVFSNPNCDVIKNTYDTATCVAIDCDEINFSQTNVSDFCEGSTINLALYNFNIGNYSVSWNGGTPGTQTINTITPTQDTIITIEVVNMDQQECPSVVKEFNLEEKEVPEVSIASSSPNDTSCYGVDLQFTASPNYFDRYIFYDGYAVVQDGGDPVYVTDTLENNRPIFVYAVDNDCPSVPSDTIQTAMVDPLYSPQINCGFTDSGSVEFVWDSIPGSLGYQVQINKDTFVTPSSGLFGLSHFVDSLFVGDSVKCVVEALGYYPCGNSIYKYETVWCHAVNCDGNSFDADFYPVVCDEDSIELIVSNLTSNPYSITWGDGVPTQDTSIVIYPDGDTTVTITIVDSNQLKCRPLINYFEAEVTTVPTLLLIPLTDTNYICFGGEMSFRTLPAYYNEYTFYDDSVELQRGPSPFLTTTELSVNNNLKVEVLHKNCLASSRGEWFHVKALPEVNYVDSVYQDSVCFGQDVWIQVQDSTFDRYKYYFDGQLLFDSTMNEYISNVYAVAQGYVNTVVIDTFGCISDSLDTLPLTVLPVPEMTLTNTADQDTICDLLPVEFTAQPFGLPRYIFYDNDTVIYDGSDSVFNWPLIDIGNEIRVIGINEYECSSVVNDTNRIYIKSVANPTITEDEDTLLLCSGEDQIVYSRIDSNHFVDVIYNWSNGLSGIGESVLEVQPPVSTLYILSTTYKGCESAKDSIMIVVDNEPKPIADAGEDVVLCIGDSVQLLAQGGRFFEWQEIEGIRETDVANPWVNPTENTIFEVLVRNIACTDEDEIEVVMDRCLTDITGPIPQVYSPNNDNVNDQWIIPDIDYFKDSHILIYNRWGNVVYESNGYLNRWEGRSKNAKDLPDGTYFYVVDLGNGVIHEGFVIIQR